MTDQTPTRDETSSRSAQTRARLLTAATAAFAERGFHGTTTRDIAAAAGMSPAAVYVHHRSKEDLLFQLSRDGHRTSIGVIDAADDPTAKPTDRLRAVVRAFAEYHARDHVGARIVNYELTALSPEHRAEIIELRRVITGRMRAVVDAGVATGEFRIEDPRTITTALLSMSIDIARWFREGGVLTPAQIGDFYADVAVRVVDAAPSADTTG